MRDKVTVAYRGAKYELGRGPTFFGIWAAGASRSQPLEWWPDAPEGWAAAWSRFTEIETPGTIAPVGRRTDTAGQGAFPGGAGALPAGAGTFTAGAGAFPGGAGAFTGGAGTFPAGAGAFPGGAGAFTGGAGTFPAGAGTFPAGPGAFPAGASASPAGPGTYEAGQGGIPAGPRAAGTSVAGPIAAGLLAAGVVLGVVGLFPGYLAGASLANQPSELVPHVIYLAGWSVSAVLIVLGGTRLRLGALLGAGLSLVTFGLFFADAGTAMAGGLHLADAGLVLGIAGWLACAAGSAIAVLLPAAGRPGALRPDGRPRPLGRPRGAQVGAAILLVLAGLGAAIAFAPSWDRFTLRTAIGLSQSLTAGNAFANPGTVIAGDVAVMVALAAVVIAAALWRPVRHGAVLLIGATIPMVAQAISALIQAGEAVTPGQFGFSPTQAQRLGLTISSGLTSWFWIYCACVLVLVISCAWMLFTPRETVGVPAGPYPGTRPGDDLWRSAAPPEPDDGLWATVARADDDADGHASDPASTDSGSDVWPVPPAAEAAAVAPDPGPPAVDSTESAAAVSVPPRSTE